MRGGKKPLNPPFETVSKRHPQLDGGDPEEKLVDFLLYKIALKY